ncbi:unnamed protein product [Mytilus edulis]|uniref:Uncharacterized protein n=1 Tax=Mytilus edulis TaxID=6550 RepID=A0A8S3VLR8_MYTED|nr:unnamed protein product [Mytilus edulis]
MAEGGDKVITHQPKSPSLEIDPDIKKMMDAFAKMGVKPKADTSEELTDWMMGFLKLKGKIKEEPEAKIELQPPPIPSKPEDKVTKTIINHPPKIAWFSGTETKAGDVTFEVWRHEVRVLMRQNYDKDAVLNTPHTSKAATDVKEAPSEIEELKGMIHQLVNRMDTYETNKQTPPWQQQQRQQQQQWQQQQQHWQQQQPWNGQQQQQKKVKDNRTTTTQDNNHKGTPEIILSAGDADNLDTGRQTAIPESQGVHSDESSDEEPLELVIVEHDASSDTTITEEQHDDSTVTDTTEDSDSDGDAHSQEATDMEAEGTETESVIRSASTVSSEDSQQEDSPDEASTASSPEPVRRSTRERQQPAWMRSGTFDLSKSVGTPVSDSEWYKKVQFITSLAGTHLFRDLQSEAAKTILDIVKTPSAEK